MNTQEKLQAIEEGTHEYAGFNDEQKRIAKRCVKAHVWNKILQTKIGHEWIINKPNTNTFYEILFDKKLARKFGHTSPVFVHPMGAVVIYLKIKVNGAVTFPRKVHDLPIMVYGPPTFAPMRDIEDLLMSLGGE